MFLLTQKIIRKLPRFILGFLIAVFIVTSHLLLSDLVLKDHRVYAAFNKQINYQGKLTDATNTAVADGTYHMKFWLLASPTAATTTALWAEDRSTAAGDRVTVSNGLFSVMLGSSTPLTGVDFNQTLYLGVEIGGSAGSPVFDGEMSPRKKLGAVPASFTSDYLDGLSSEQFLRSDSANATSTATTWLTFTQNGAGNIASFVGPSSAPVFNILSNGQVVVGTSTPSGRFTVWGAGTGTGVLANFVNNASTSVMRILDNGNVGIGTTSPYAALSVVGEAVASYFTATSTTATSSIAYDLSVGGRLKVNQTGTNAVIVGDTTGDTRGVFSLDIQSGRSVSTQVASGGASIAIGFHNTSSNTNSSASGYSNTSSGVSSSAFGSSNIASQESTSAFGYLNLATALQSTAVGYSNTASGIYGTALGYSNTASQESASAVGKSNSASAWYSSAFGVNNTVSATSSSSFGFTNVVSGYQATAVGSNLTVSADGASAFGNGITNSTATSTQIGPSNAAKLTILGQSGRVGYVGIGTTSPYAALAVVGQVVADYFTATSTTATSTFAYDVSVIGRLKVQQTTTNATIIGDTTGNARGTNATDVQSGRSAVDEVASGLYSSAFGYRNTASGDNSTAIGFINISSASRSTSVGYSNAVSGSSATALGDSNLITSTFSTAVGYSNSALGSNSSSVGSANIVSGVAASAFGINNKSFTLNSVLFGNRNFTSTGGLASVAIGVMNNQTGGTLNTTTGAVSGTATGTATVGALSSAVGISNTVSANFGQAFGYNNTVSGLNSLAYGFGNTVSVTGSSAFGSFITNSTASSTQIGPRDAAKLTILGETGKVGYVGIGTTTPGTIFSLGNTGNDTVNISTTGTSTFGYGINVRTGCIAVNGVCITAGVGSTQWTTNGSNIYYTTGNVGIGTTSPFTGLGVVGGITTDYINATSTTATSTFSGGLKAGGSSGLSVLQNGKVGIGTASPNATLDVSGASGVITAIRGAANQNSPSLVLDGGNTANSWFDIGTSLATQGIRMYGGTSYATGPAFQIWPTGSTFQGMYFDAGTASGADINFRTEPGGTVALKITQGTGNSVFTPVSDGQDSFRLNNAAGNAAIQLGTFPSAPTYGGFWAGNVTPSATNYAFIANGTTETIFNVETGGQIRFRIGQETAPNAMNLNTTGLSLSTNSGVSRLNVNGGAAFGSTYSSILAPTDGAIFEGNVGIGTSTPYAKLSVVHNSASAKSPAFVVATSTSGGVPPLFFISATTTGALDWARVAIGTTTNSNGAGLRDQFVVGGRIYSTWREMRCDVFGASFVANTSGTTDVTQVCGPFAFDAVTDGGITVQTTANPSFGRIFGGATPANGDAGILRTWTKNVVLAENPVMEATVKLVAATSSVTYFVGFTDTTAGTNAAAIPTNGVYFIATSTNTWRIIGSKSGVHTYVETGVATSTSFQRMRIETTSTGATFLINGAVVGEISSGGLPLGVNMSPAIGVASTGTNGIQRSFDIGSVRVWYDDPPGGYGPLAGGPRGGEPEEPEFDPATYDAVSGAELSNQYIVDDAAKFLPGALVANNPRGGSQVFLTTKKNDQNALGVIGTDSQLVMGQDAMRNSVRVAVAGRAPIMVSAENGQIVPGDYITSSSLPGFGMKSTVSGHVVGRALEKSAPTGTSTIMMIVEPTYYAGSSFTTDENGNSGFGTSSPSYKLNVSGDAGAKGFAITGARTGMRNVTAITPETSLAYLESIRNVNISTYRLPTDSATTTRLGIISDEAPREILTASGDVDVYKLATFTLAGVKAQQLKIDSLEARITAIEQSITDGGGAFSVSGILQSFERLGVKITNGIAQFRNLVVERLVVGTPEKPNGITLYDEVTGEPYCVKISNGKLKNFEGECDELEPEINVVPHATSTDTVSGDVISGPAEMIPVPEPLPSLESPDAPAGDTSDEQDVSSKEAQSSDDSGDSSESSASDSSDSSGSDSSAGE